MPAVNRCVFRVAAGPQIGFGHLMRARALARCLSIPAVFSVRGSRAARRTARVLGCRLAPPSLRLTARDVVVVDDPRLAQGKPWIDAARQAGARTVSVHDGAPVHPANIVVDGNIFAKPSTTRPRVLTGPAFYLLDRNVLVARRLRTRASRRLGRRPRVLVALGGGSHVRALAPHIVGVIAARCPQAVITVAAGFARGGAPRLAGARWLAGTRGLSRALKNTDVVVVSGGVTLYEACAIGVPAVACAIVPAQRQAIRAFARREAVIDGGAISRSGRDLARLTDHVEALLSCAALRNRLSRRAARLVDARGAKRVAERIHRIGEARG